MPRHARLDEPGAWHHVMNRGIAKRTLFENEHDIRTFLARLALAVRARQLEVHAFCLLTTHFHLLVRSPEAQLSQALQFIQNSYSRWFNRTRRRDGPLYRARFRSKRVDSLEYRLQLVRYIDSNPVEAGLAASPAEYPHGSARCYAQDEGPIWLTREWIEAEVRRGARATEFRPQDYELSFGGSVPDGVRRLIERRIERQCAGSDPLDDLIGMAPERVLAWMRRKAELADGTEVGLPVCDAEVVGELVAAARVRHGEWRLDGRGRRSDVWSLIEVALLRELCGTTLAETGERMGITLNGAALRHARHKRELLVNEEYARGASELAAEALARCFGARSGASRV